jgi:hypothetical protein
MHFYGYEWPGFTKDFLATFPQVLWVLSARSLKCFSSTTPCSNFGLDFKMDSLTRSINGER